jgi:hypothetical protein
MDAKKAHSNHAFERFQADQTITAMQNAGLIAIDSNLVSDYAID